MSEQTITADRVVMGTAGYMAPEQVAGKAADARADQFALGAIVYELLTGRRAFRRDTAVQTMTSVLEDEPPPLAGLCPEASPAVDAIVRRCLAKAPEGRYASTRDLAHDLRDALEQAVVDSRSHPSGVRVVAGRHPRWWLATAAVAVVAAVAAAVGLWPRAAREPAPTGAVTPATRHIVVLPFTNITKDPADDALAHAALGEAFWRKYEIERNAQWIEQAMDHSRQALALDDRHAGVHVTLAMIARGQGRFEEAVAVAQRAVEVLRSWGLGVLGSWGLGVLGSWGVDRF